MTLTQEVTDAKSIRARVIKAHLTTAGLPPRVVCFSCGNAASRLRVEGLEVIEVGPKGFLDTNLWWHPEDITRCWPGHFDATSGHLSVTLMERIGRAIYQRLRRTTGFDQSRAHVVPCGSGETLVSLALAAPALRLVARYDNREQATTYNRAAPLNGLVRQLAESVRGLPRGA